MLTTKAAAAAWSPTEAMLAYTEQISDTHPLSIYHLATQQVTKPAPSLSSVDAFAWSPDATKLAVSSGEALYVVGADGSDLHQVASGVVTDIKWAPNGSSLAFLLRTSPWPLSFSLWAAQPDGSSLRQLSSADAGTISLYSWSPDSAKVAYAGADALWLTDAAGTAQQHASVAFVQRMAWSPDSSQVAYAVQTGDTTYALRAIGADGASERDLLPSAGKIGALVWQEDQQTLVYWAGDVLGTVSAQGGAATPLVSTVTAFIGQDLSGDLLFVNLGVQGYVIWSIALDGSGEHLLGNVSNLIDHTYLAP